MCVVAVLRRGNLLQLASVEPERAARRAPVNLNGVHLSAVEPREDNRPDPHVRIAQRTVEINLLAPGLELPCILFSLLSDIVEDAALALSSIPEHSEQWWIPWRAKVERPDSSGETSAEPSLGQE